MSDPVRAFELAFAEYVGARHAIALCNGTATLHTALVALGVKPGDRVAVPPLTMSATTIAVLHAGGVPVFCDVHPETWLMGWTNDSIDRATDVTWMPVSLYGLHMHRHLRVDVDDAAQTLRPHKDHIDGGTFTSYSFQASKILALGEGGMLVTNDEELAVRAREFSSLGYRMRADQPRIDKRVLKDPAYERHHSLGWNYRMAPDIARRGLRAILPDVHEVARGRAFGVPVYEQRRARLVYLRKQERQDCATLYRDAVAGCSWITLQHVPEGWTHDYWSYAVALESAELWHPFVDSIERHGGERPYAAWKLTYQEPAFRHLAEDGTCPIAENLQPRLVQGQTNDYEAAKRNADAWARAVVEIGGATP